MLLSKPPFIQTPKLSKKTNTAKGIIVFLKYLYTISAFLVAN
jgi:hypothetical protein